MMNATYMIADDSMFARMLVKDAVKQIDPEAVFFEGASGDEALAHNNEANVDIDWYLLDINMGGLNGVQTAASLIKAGVHKRHIALVTGNRSEDLQREASDMGLEYIHKAISPSDVDKFVERLRHFLTI